MLKLTQILKTHSYFENSFKFLLSWWSRFKRISIRQNQAWQKRKQNTDKSITIKDTNKGRITVNKKKGCTQTAYAGIKVNILERWNDSNTTIFPNTCFFSSQTSRCAEVWFGICFQTPLKNVKTHWKFYKFSIFQWRLSQIPNPTSPQRDVCYINLLLDITKQS